MQIKKELLLFCTLLVLSLGLLVASDLNKTPASPAKKCKTHSKCCRKVAVPHPNATPWNFLTEGMLHIASV